MEMAYQKLLFVLCHRHGVLDSLRSSLLQPIINNERSEELGKNLALGGIYRLPKFLKISKQNKFPQKNYRYNIIPLYFETFNKLKSTDIVCFRQNMSEFRRLKA